MCYSGGTASTLVTEGAPNPRAKITPAAGRGPCALAQDSLPVGAPRPGPDRPAAEERYRCLRVPALCPGPTGRVSEFEADSGHPEGSLLCGTLSKALGGAWCRRGVEGDPASHARVDPRPKLAWHPRMS